ncbi:MAG: hypothetical protein GY767_20265 [Shimia sp.]|nr:hypothetical protein [Shimia sp.]
MNHTQAVEMYQDSVREAVTHRALKEAADGAPATIGRLAFLLGLPASTVELAVKELVEEGVQAMPYDGGPVMPLRSLGGTELVMVIQPHSGQRKRSGRRPKAAQRRSCRAQQAA